MLATLALGLAGAIPAMGFNMVRFRGRFGVFCVGKLGGIFLFFQIWWSTHHMSSVEISFWEGSENLDSG